MNNVKDTWEYFGKNDPYFAVSTLDKFRSENLTEQSRRDFFLTGEQHVARVFDEIETNLCKGFRPRRALDFGCGVGRVVIPLAARAAEVIGVDISEAMLGEAARNCELNKVENATFLQTNDFLAAHDLELDLIHSVIVFQHIAPDRGLEIVEKLVKSLAVGGIGVLHFSYSIAANNMENFRVTMYRRFPFLYRLRAKIKGSRDEPMIPGYIYDLNDVMAILQANDCHNCLVRFSRHGFDGVVLFFQKSKLESF